MCLLKKLKKISISVIYLLIMDIYKLHRDYLQIRKNYKIIKKKLEFSNDLVKGYGNYSRLIDIRYEIIEKLDYYKQETLENAVFKLNKEELYIIYDFINNDNLIKLNTLPIFNCHFSFLVGITGVYKRNLELASKFIRYAANINFRKYGPILWLFCKMNNIQFDKKQNTLGNMYYVCYDYFNYLLGTNKINFPDRIMNNLNLDFITVKVMYLSINKICNYEELEYAASYGCAYSAYILYNMYLENDSKIPHKYRYPSDKGMEIATHYWIMAASNLKDKSVSLSCNILYYMYRVDRKKYEKYVILYLKNNVKYINSDFYNILQKEHDKIVKKYKELETELLYSPGGEEYLKCKARFEKNMLF